MPTGPPTVQSAADVQFIRKVLDEAGGTRVKIISKIENAEVGWGGWELRGLGATPRPSPSEQTKADTSKCNI